MTAVDAQVRFSWIMPDVSRVTDELLMVYAGIMAHGTSLTAVECARMIPQLFATSIRQAALGAGRTAFEPGLRQAVLESCSDTDCRHLGRSDLHLLT